LSGAAQFDSNAQENMPGCLENTRVALLKTIEDWIYRQDVDTPHIFWLNGLAGTGKSTLAKTVAMEASRKQILGASFFFSRNNTDQMNASHVFPSIACQLAQRYPSFKSELAQTLQNKIGFDSLSLQNQLCDFIVTPLRLATDIKSPLVIVIDALDECADRGAIFRLIHHLATELRGLNVVLRIFMTSRGEYDIWATFQPRGVQEKTHAFILHDIETSIVREDIEQFLHTHLSELVNRRPGMFGPEPWPPLQAVHDLAVKADNLFIYAATAVRFIADENYAPQEQLDDLLEDRVGKGDGHAHEHLDKLYLQVLRIALLDSSKPELLARFRNVVGTIALLWDTLTLQGLADLLQIRKHELCASLLRLHSVVIVPNNENAVIRLIHPSFRDFITSPTRCTEDRFLISAPEHHRRLALACFDALKRGLTKSNICSIVNPSNFNSEIDDLQKRISLALQPDVQYACRHWATHLHNASSEYSDDGCDPLVDALDKFSRDRLLLWMEALSLLGFVREAVRALRQAQKWLTVSGIVNLCISL
jgi:hypothetical protein